MAAIRCARDTPDHCTIEQPLLSEIRIKIEKHIEHVPEGNASPGQRKADPQGVDGTQYLANDVRTKAAGLRPPVS